MQARLRVADGTAGELLRRLRTTTPTPARGGLGPLAVAAQPEAMTTESRALAGV